MLTPQLPVVRADPAQRTVAAFTIGHSNRSIEDFLALLLAWRIELLIDVRRQPISSRCPHFSRRELQQSVNGVCAYEWQPDVGGMRSPAPNSPNDALKNDAFRGYADHMLSPEFRHAVERILRAAASQQVALMCAEADWRECHRSLLSDYLNARGATVRHIRSVTECESHALTRGARLVGGSLSYTLPKQPTLFD